MSANPFFSKGIFSWNVPAVAGGDPARFARVLKLAGFEAVYLKVADGPRPHVPSRAAWPVWGENVRAELVAALRAEGLAVIGWGFLYGRDPRGEGQMAASQVRRFGLDGYVFDVEGDFDAQPGAVANAHTVMGEFKSRAPGVPTALAWWPLPRSPYSGTQWHPIPVAKAFMEHVDVAMPMQYWEGSTPANAVWYLEASMRLWAEITAKPMVAAGRAYTGDAGVPTPEAMAAYAKAAVERGVKGLTWWSLDAAVGQATIWAALAAMTPFGLAAPVEQALTLERLAERVATLEQRVGALERA